MLQKAEAVWTSIVSVEFPDSFIPWTKFVHFSQQTRVLLSALLKPVSLAAFVLSGWRLCSDLGWSGAFPFEGLLSRWPFWLAIGILTQQGSGWLYRNNAEGVAVTNRPAAAED